MFLRMAPTSFVDDQSLGIETCCQCLARDSPGKRPSTSCVSELHIHACKLTQIHLSSRNRKRDQGGNT